LTPRLVAAPEDVTPEWLTEVLHDGGALEPATSVVSLAWRAIGTGQVGDNIRFTLAYEGPPGPDSIVCKFGSRDPVSAAAGIAFSTYETEVAFYRDLASTVDVRCPRCYFADVVPGTAEAVVVMEDLARAVQGDQINGCTIGQAELAIDEAAKLHGPRWGDPTLAELGWLGRTQGGSIGEAMPLVWDGFVERYGDRLDPVTFEAGAHLGELVTNADGRPGPRTAAHCDFRLDNMLFDTGDGGRPLTIVDWQTVQLGQGTRDVAYFLGNAFDAEIRRSCERTLVARYHQKLVDDYGVDDFSFDQCWDEYVRFSFSSMAMAVLASMMVGRTDRGDAMFLAMANRSAQMAADLDAPGAIRAG
jgi:Phosphotransferase enzyme family